MEPIRVHTILKLASSHFSIFFTCIVNHYFVDCSPVQIVKPSNSMQIVIFNTHQHVVDFILAIRVNRC